MKKRRCEICGEIIDGKSYQIRSKHGVIYPVFCEECWEQSAEDAYDPADNSPEMKRGKE